MSMTFHESYGGEITRPLLTAIRKNNVSPMDYMMLEDEFGQGNYSAIQAAVKERSTSGSYRMPLPKGW